jgi:hypothetical protein
MNPEIAKALGVSLVLLVGFVGIGGMMLSALGYRTWRLTPLRLVPVAAALGFAVFSYVAWLLVAFGPPNAVVIISLAAAGMVAGRRFLVDAARESLSSLPQFLRQLRRPIPLACAILAAGFIALASMNWLTPVKEGDALRGYMFTARWLFTHGLTLSPYNTVYFLYPFNTEMVYSLSYAFATDLIGKCLDGLLGMLFLAGVYEFARRYASPLPSFFAAASLGIMTEFVISWGTGKVDILCAFTFFAGVSLLFAQPGPALRTVAAAAFLVGTSCAQKYTVWALAPGFVAAVWLFARREGLKLKETAALCAAASVVVALCLVPHFAKNVAWTGNPIAPFASGLIPTANAYLNPFDYSDASPMRLVDHVALPYKLFLDADAKRWPGPLPIMILLGLPCYLVLRKRVPGAALVLMVATVQLAVWIALRRGEWLAPRFLLIPTALFLVVSAAGLDAVSAGRRVVRGAVVATLLCAIAWSGVWQNRHFRVSWPFVAGLETRSAWQDRVVPARGYSALQALAPDLDHSHRLFTDASLYNVPEDKIGFLNTERELAEFLATPPSEQLSFLRRRCFAYFYFFLSERTLPPWSEPLETVARYVDGQERALQYALLRLEGNDPAEGCRSEDAHVTVVKR